VKAKFSAAILEDNYMHMANIYSSAFSEYQDTFTFWWIADMLNEKPRFEIEFIRQLVKGDVPRKWKPLASSIYEIVGHPPEVRIIVPDKGILKSIDPNHPWEPEFGQTKEDKVKLAERIIQALLSIHFDLLIVDRQIARLVGLPYPGKTKPEPNLRINPHYGEKYKIGGMTSWTGTEILVEYMTRKNLACEFLVFSASANECYQHDLLNHRGFLQSGNEWRYIEKDLKDLLNLERTKFAMKQIEATLSGLPDEPRIAEESMNIFHHYKTLSEQGNRKTIREYISLIDMLPCPGIPRIWKPSEPSIWIFRRVVVMSYIFLLNKGKMVKLQDIADFTDFLTPDRFRTALCRVRLNQKTISEFALEEYELRWLYRFCEKENLICPPQLTRKIALLPSSE
jgi:hypothetical protein